MSKNVLMLSSQFGFIEIWNKRKFSFFDLMPTWLNVKIKAKDANCQMSDFILLLKLRFIS